MAHISYVYFGDRYSEETGGQWGYLVDETNIVRVEWLHVFAALSAGHTVTVRSAVANEIKEAEQYLASYKEVQRLEALEAMEDQLTQ